MGNDSMKLPEGKTCSDCAHCKKCCAMFGAKPENTWCDFAPSRFAIPWRSRAEAAEVRIVELEAQTEKLSSERRQYFNQMCHGKTDTEKQRLRAEVAEAKVKELQDVMLRPDRPVQTPELLYHIADRLVLHGDNPNVDFVLDLRDRADRMAQMRIGIGDGKQSPTVKREPNKDRGLKCKSCGLLFFTIDPSEKLCSTCR